MLTTKITDHDHELKLLASKLSIKELDTLINDCLDKKQYEDATVFAKIYNKRITR